MARQVTGGRLSTRLVVGVVVVYFASYSASMWKTRRHITLPTRFPIAVAVDITISINEPVSKEILAYREHLGQ